MREIILEEAERHIVFGEQSRHACCCMIWDSLNDVEQHFLLADA